MTGNVVQALALRPDVVVENLDAAQWANAEQLLAKATWPDGKAAAAVRAFVSRSSSAVLGVVDAGTLWASLVVTVDGKGAPVSVTTVNGTAVESGRSLAALAAGAVQWVRVHHGLCSLGLFFDKPHAEVFLSAPDKAAALRAASAAGGLVLSPFPPALAIALA